jgi:hypothetical protein
MSAISHTDATVFCNGSDDGQACGSQLRTDDLALRDGTAADVRRELRLHHGWMVDIGSRDGSRQRLDYCPRHKPAIRPAKRLPRSHRA